MYKTFYDNNKRKYFNIKSLKNITKSQQGGNFTVIGRLQSGASGREIYDIVIDSKQAIGKIMYGNEMNITQLLQGQDGTKYVVSLYHTIPVLELNGTMIESDLKKDQKYYQRLIDVKAVLMILEKLKPVVLYDLYTQEQEFDYNDPVLNESNIRALSDFPEIVIQTADANVTGKKLKEMLDISLALKFMHSRNVAHGDMKTDNMGYDHLMNIKLYDFGESRIFIESQDIEAGHYKLHPAKNDVIALAMIIINMLVNKNVFSSVGRHYMNMRKEEASTNDNYKSLLGKINIEKKYSDILPILYDMLKIENNWINILDVLIQKLKIYIATQ